RCLLIVQAEHLADSPAKHPLLARSDKRSDDYVAKAIDLLLRSIGSSGRLAASICTCPALRSARARARPRQPACPRTAPRALRRRRWLQAPLASRASPVPDRRLH